MEVTAYELEAEFAAARHNAAKFGVELSWECRDIRTFKLFFNEEEVETTETPYAWLKGLNVGLRLGGKEILKIVSSMSDIADTMDI